MRHKAELSTASSRSEQRRSHHGFRGTPPLPTGVSLADLADDVLLTEFQVAAFLQISTNTVQAWRRDPDHALAWEALPHGYIRYRAGALRRYLALGKRRQQARLGDPQVAAEEKLTADPRGEPKAAAAAPQPSHRPMALERAIALLGSQDKMAHAAGVHTNTIWKALHGQGPVSHKLALKIEEATSGKVRAEELMLECLSSTPSSERRRP